METHWQELFARFGSENAAKNGLLSNAPSGKAQGTGRWTRHNANAGPDGIIQLHRGFVAA
jgi:hypothetical protein